MAKKKIEIKGVKTETFSKRFFARILVRCVNTLLLPTERCCIQREIENGKENTGVSQCDIAIAVSQWKKSAKDTLCRNIRKYKDHWLASMTQPSSSMPPCLAQRTFPSRKVLPTSDEISRNVDAIFSSHKKLVFSSRTQADLIEAVSALDNEYDVLYGEMMERVGIFAGYVAKSGRSVQFVGEAIRLRDAMREFMVLPVQHEVNSERLLLQTLLHVIDAWETFCKRKNAADLDAFYTRIEFAKKNVDALRDQVFPKTKQGKRVDLESFISGVCAEKRDDPLM